MPITPNKDPDNVHLGLGILGIKPFPAGSPPADFADVGYLKGCTIAYNRELRDFESAGILVKRLAFRDRLTMNADWAEISITNLATLIPGTVAGNKLTFGGSRVINRYSVRFESERDDGKLITVDIFKATPAGESRLAFAEEEFITYPVEFAAEVDESKTSGQQYGSIEIASGS
jgi:hypothetical protein